MLRIYCEQEFGNWKPSSYKKNRFHFQPFALRCEMTATPLGRVFGHDRVCNEYCPLRAQGPLTALKGVSLDSLPYLTWDVTQRDSLV